MSSMDTKKSGLSKKEAKARLAEYGRNEPPKKKKASDIKILLEQLKSPLIYVLLFAAIVTFFLKDFTDTAVIMAAVVINTILGFYQERKAERALEALKSYLHPTASVIRNNKRQEIPVEEVVVGDVVILAAGEKVPADGKVIEAYNLMVNEAILTGESVPVAKSVGELT